MSRAANPVRGEVAFGDWTLRPTFGALVAAEAELGPLFALVDRAADGGLTLAETAALFWHCCEDEVARDAMGEALVERGLAAATPVLRVLLTQILAGR